MPRLFLAAPLLFLSEGSSGADGAAETPPVGVMGRRPQQPPAASWSFLRRKRDEEPASYLKWVAFEGKLPADAVSNWNGYAKRMEYVCSTRMFGCNAGAYVPIRGPFCFFPFGEREWKANDFKVLVNVGGFEALDWMDGSFGSVPKNAVEVCPSTDVFVGRNDYGLGKVSKDQRAAFIVVDSEEVWYKWYQVLVVKKGLADVTISDVCYNMSGAAERGEDVTLTKTTVRNEGCQGVRKAVTLEETTEVEHDWGIDQRVFATIHGVLQAALLVFNGTGWEVTN
ncbi:PREDICTED: natterin-3-like, partial [Cariama cristata]